MPLCSLPPERRSRLVKLLGLLSSHHEAERAVAGGMADQLIRECKLTWGDVIASAAPAATKEARSASEHPWQEMAGKILGSGCRVTEWEKNFCEDLLHGWRGPVLTERQQQVLTRIFAQRVERYER